MKTALVIEGGGMRSAYASGALVALRDLGYKHFDVVAGTSAGACCAINFIGGTPERNFKILHEHLPSLDFINYAYAFSTRSVVDINFLLDVVLAKRVLLPLDKFYASPTRLYITATNCETGQAVYFEGHEHDPAQLIERLRASCAMPYLYRHKVYLDGKRHVDGGVAVSIPIQKAIDEGCQKIVVIGTRPKGYRKKHNPFGWLNYIFFPFHPKMAKALNERWKEYNQTLDWLENPPEGVQVHFIRPEGKLPVGRTTKNRDKIKAGYEMGYQDALRVLQGKQP